MSLSPSGFCRTSAPRGSAFTVAIEVAGREAFKTYVEMDLGLAIINAYYVTTQDRKRLNLKNVGEYFREKERSIVIREGKYLSSLEREFIEMFTLHCKDAKGESSPEEPTKR